MSVTEIRQFIGQGSEVLSVAFLPDGRRAVSSGFRTIIVWDVETGTPLSTLDGHTNVVPAVAISPDGNFVLSAGWDETIRLWDVNTRREVLRIKAHKWGASSVAFSPDGRYALSGSDHVTRLARGAGVAAVVLATEMLPWSGTYAHDEYDRSIKLWDLTTGRNVKKWRIGDNFVSSLDWSPDGRMIAAGTDSRVRMWETQSWGEIGKWTLALKGKGAGGTTRGVAFSPNGLLLLTGGKDKAVRLWDVNSGNLVHEFVGHEAEVNSVAYSSDGRYVLSGSDDNTMMLWNVETGQSVARYFGHAGRVNSVAFSRDMRYALSGSDDNTVRLWPIPGFQSPPLPEFRNEPFYGSQFPQPPPPPPPY